MKVIFYNEANTGDGFFVKSFIKQFCELNQDIDIYIMLKYNSFLFSDIPNLHLILPNININNNYTNDGFNGFCYDPINSLNINNYDFIQCYNIMKNDFQEKNYLVLNDTIYIKTWITKCTPDWNWGELECNLNNVNIYYNNIINNINIKHKLNFKIIKNFDLLPSIPYTDITQFLLVKQNKKIIFYYNYYNNSGDKWNFNSNFNHDNNILKLSNKYPDYVICCALKPNVSNFNIISIEDFGYIKQPSCENIANALYCAMNSNIVYSFDTGACFYYLNDKFNETFKGIWYHVSLTEIFFNRINMVLKNNKVKLINIID